MDGVSVKLNDLDMYQEFGCALISFVIGTPSAQVKMVQIPLRNGSIDLSEYLTNDIRYNDRVIKMKFMYSGFNDFSIKFSQIQNEFHGKRANIIFDRDAGYFYSGRLSVGSFQNLKYGGTFEIEAQCDPYKYLVTSGEDWLWDPFDFETGYINSLANIEVDGEKSVVLIADEAPLYPTVISNAQMTVQYAATTVTIPIGRTELYDFNLLPGNNTLTFRGNGIVTIEYRGGRL